jgi:hypothetical protein
VQRTVVKTRSVEFTPFSLSFFLFLNGGVWSAYSVLVKDLLIGVRTYARSLEQLLINSFPL